MSAPVEHPDASVIKAALDEEEDAPLRSTAIEAEVVAARTVTSAHALTAEEAQWSRALKDALAAEGVVPPDSDFEIATFAIIGKGDLTKSVERVKKYNEVVRAQYAHTPEEGLRAVGFLNRKWPGCMLAGAADAAGRPMIVCDVNPYVPAQLEGEAEWRAFFLEFVVLLEACTSDLDDCRNGCIFITQCEGMGWKNFSLEVEKRAAVLYQDAIPCRYHSLPMVNAGKILRVCIRICKAFLKQKLADRLIVCKQERLFDEHGFDRASLPPLLGGTFGGRYEDWMAGQLKRRAESVAKVRIP